MTPIFFRTNHLCTVVIISRRFRLQRRFPEEQVVIDRVKLYVCFKIYIKMENVRLTRVTNTFEEEAVNIRPKI